MYTHRRLLGLLVVLVVGLTPQPVASNYRQKRIVGGTEAPPPPVDDPVVFTVNDEREARVYGTRDPQSGYYLFRGIRYAEPPVGNRRFQRSVPVHLEGDVDATQWAAPCPQPDSTGRVIGSEDCLFLNVFTPSLPDATDGYPVLVWIHGGGFRRGAATQYEMRSLVNKKVIVVSIQYRLGSLGFLSSGTKDLSGNNGLFDMILATEWVREYIEFFGGNPNKITAFGQGSGASSAFLLGLSKFGNTYFSGIVAMSGSLLSHFAVDREPRKMTESMATNNNCPLNNTVQMVRCLRELPAERLIDQDTKHESFAKQARNFITDLSSLLGPGPVVEGSNDLRSLPNFVTDEPEDSLSFDNLPDIPLLTGVIKDEVGGAVYGPFKDTITDTLKKVPDFITKTLVPSLQQFVPIIGNVSQQFVPEAFSKYLNPFGSGKNNQKIDSIAKVTEALNDAIFNVPAFLTVKNWSKKSKAFLYSFDHNSKQGFGKDFLDGLPIVGNSAETGKTSHGDDLGYIFEPNNIFGKALPKSRSFDEEDEQVKEVFTDLITNFARSGNASVNQKSNDGGLLSSLPSFSGNDGEDGFLSITSKPQISKNFRFCEMGLWTGIEERFKSAACSLFHVDLKNPLKTVERTLKTISYTPTLAKVGKVSEYLNLSAISNPPVKSPIKLPINPQILPNPLNPIGDGGSSIIPNPLPNPSIKNPLDIIPNPLPKKPNEKPSLLPKIPEGTKSPILPLPFPKSPLGFG